MEATKIPPLDPVTSILFDMEMRIIVARENLYTAELLLNKARDISKERPLKKEDFEHFESLLIVVKEFFDVVSDDLISALLQALFEQNTSKKLIKIDE